MGFTPRPRRYTLQVVATGQPAHWEAGFWEYDYTTDSVAVLLTPRILAVPSQHRGWALGQVAAKAFDQGAIVAQAWADRYLTAAPGRPEWIEER
jgi:hypothetical protein